MPNRQYKDPSPFLTPGPASTPTSEYGYITPVNQGLHRGLSSSSLFAGLGETPNSRIDIDLTVNEGLRHDVSNSSFGDPPPNLDDELPSSMLLEARRQPGMSRFHIFCFHMTHTDKYGSLDSRG
jgi:hypothetical protein